MWVSKTFINKIKIKKNSVAIHLRYITHGKMMLRYERENEFGTKGGKFDSVISVSYNVKYIQRMCVYS